MENVTLTGLAAGPVSGPVGTAALPSAAPAPPTGHGTNVGAIVGGVVGGVVGLVLIAGALAFFMWRERRRQTVWLLPTLDWLGPLPVPCMGQPHGSATQAPEKSWFASSTDTVTFLRQIHSIQSGHAAGRSRECLPAMLRKLVSQC